MESLVIWKYKDKTSLWVYYVHKCWSTSWWSYMSMLLPFSLQKLHFVSSSGSQFAAVEIPAQELSGIQQWMVRGLLCLGCFVLHYPVHPNPDLVAAVPCRQMGWLQPVTHIISAWGTWEALLPWTSLFISWDGETWALTMFAQLSYWATAWITPPLCSIPWWGLKLLMQTPREYFCLFQFWHCYQICDIIFL